MSAADIAALAAAIALHGENTSAALHVLANTHAQASASSAWLRDGAESIAAAIERGAVALERLAAAVEHQRRQ